MPLVRVIEELVEIGYSIAVCILPGIEFAGIRPVQPLPAIIHAILIRIRVRLSLRDWGNDARLFDYMPGAVFDFDDKALIDRIARESTGLIEDGSISLIG